MSIELVEEWRPVVGDHSEYEYTQLECWPPSLGGCMAVWSAEGWDALSVTYDGRDANTSSSRAYALMRRKRGEGLPEPPGYVARIDGNVIVGRDHGGSWWADRYVEHPDCRSEKVSQVYHRATKAEALADLAARQMTPEERAMELPDAIKSMRARLSLSATDTDWLVNEFHPEHKPEFSLR